MTVVCPSVVEEEGVVSTVLVVVAAFSESLEVSPFTVVETVVYPSVLEEEGTVYTVLVVVVVVFPESVEVSPVVETVDPSVLEEEGTV